MQRERRRISQLLHDELQQQLYALQMMVSGLQREVAPELAERTEEIHTLLKASVAMTRTLVSELDPLALQEGGFNASLDWLAEHVQERYGFTLTLHGLENCPELAALLHRSEHVIRAQQQLSGFIRDLLAEGAETGALRNDVAPDELASYCLHALTAASSLPSEAAVRRLVTVTLAGLRPHSELTCLDAAGAESPPQCFAASLSSVGRGRAFQGNATPRQLSDAGVDQTVDTSVPVIPLVPSILHA